ncbi:MULTISPECIES: serine hydrolase [unclassified Bacillus (in: firmicutes)]|uniref:serine hydrolase n=1 Tax=unclassified Bacillus (in: firmicutes) TaxID=185979 RepID=UPI0008E536DE|nr:MULTISPECIES: serine hydrolase [unclassified Bacillus (in: firmicutes)]SFA87615.1 beta-lactamase class A [Bacillus sp. UNCCL13]SFQ84333.1 beta-lactamase class A [Bacillus sp. cl95]
MNQLQVELLEIVNNCPGRASLSIDICGTSWELGGREVYKSASLIKVIILIEALRQVEQGIYSLNDKFVITNDSKVGGAGVIQALSDSIEFTYSDLLTLMIIISDNTATNQVIELLGFDSINRCCKDLGLVDTALNRKMMDFGAAQQGRENVTTSGDMVSCLKKVNEESFLSEVGRAEFLRIMSLQQFQNKLPARIDLEKVKVANKTGELPGVSHDCALIEFDGKIAYVAVLIDELVVTDDGRTALNLIGEKVATYLVEGL